MSTYAGPLALGFDLAFEGLYGIEGLESLDLCFLAALERTDAELHAQLLAARRDPSQLDAKRRSALLIALAPRLEDFLASLFGIGAEVRQLAARHTELAPLYYVKRNFVQKKAISGVKPEQAATYDGPALAAKLERLLGEPLTEDSFTRHVGLWMADDTRFAAELSAAAGYAAWAALTPQGRRKHRGGVLFRVPHKLDMQHLVDVLVDDTSGTPALRLAEHDLRHRDGFGLTDAGMDLPRALDQVHYCIKCHHQGKDSCSTGLKDAGGGIRKSVFGVPLAGCPLEEKISEMHEVKQQGCAIGALAIITIDNPMVAATGHRICNDCMKSCIFQKQDPVDIPQAETRILKDVLQLPWGFEIYSLLTRWNPLNVERPLPRRSTGYKVLVVGLGPAGFTLAHHLLNDGHAVVAIDGLKIEPLPPELSGADASGRRTPFAPLRDVRSIYESLDERVMAGFGGVAEYGITVRWDKNFLKLIRLLVERRAGFRMFGGVRFGGAITIDSAFEMGFDHIALCMGAGKPTVIPMKNGLARGVRQASDFLMALQLTGAARKDSVANLQVRLPVVVIGGGLTAIDTATEALAYYPVQVEKFLSRYEALAEEYGEAAVRRGWSDEETETAEQFIQHARAIRQERAAAAAEGRQPRLLDLLNAWGGVTIAYRRRLIDAPSYTLNHEEVALAMQEGIRFAECLTPVGVEVDRFGQCAALHLTRHPIDPATGRPSREGLPVSLPARTILVAAGTVPNTVLGREDPRNLVIHGRNFQAVDEDGAPVEPELSTKPAVPRVLTSVRGDGRAISFFGDLHPSYAGNVVKAMASARQGYSVISRMMSKLPASEPSPETLVGRLNGDLLATVDRVVRLTPNIVEVIVRAPLAARAFLPGQFYRLQNLEARAIRAGGTMLAMEGLALTGASVERGQGLLSTIVLEMGGSSDLCALLEPGEPVVLMGPTGTPTETPEQETVLLVGGGLGNAVLFSIGQTLRGRGSQVVYFAGYKKIADRYKVEEIERAADVIVWCCDEAPGFNPGRPQDRSFVGNIVEAMRTYAAGELGEPAITFQAVDRLVTIGSDGMMRAVAQARRGVLAPFLTKEHTAIASINSPMQCMMKEICAQCMQLHRNPLTGAETVVFSCFNQDQPLDYVDFDNLRTRLAQNGVQEKLTRLWIDRTLCRAGRRCTPRLLGVPTGAGLTKEKSEEARQQAVVPQA